MCLAFFTLPKIHFASQVGKYQAAPPGFEPGTFCLPFIIIIIVIIIFQIIFSFCGVQHVRKVMPLPAR